MRQVSSWQSERLSDHSLFLRLARRGTILTFLNLLRCYRIPVLNFLSEEDYRRILRFHFEKFGIVQKM